MYLKENGPSRDPLEFLARLPSFRWRELRTHLLNREVYFGRFLGRRLVFIHQEHLELFVTVTRSELALSDLAKEILEIIKEIPGISQKEINRLLIQPASKIQNALTLLEQELYISRTGWELTLTHGGFPQPRFIVLPDTK